MGDACHVCGKPLDEIYAVSCIACGRSMHFQSSESAGENCGNILTKFDACGLAFICSQCSEKAAHREETAYL